MIDGLPWPKTRNGEAQASNLPIQMEATIFRPPNLLVVVPLYHSQGCLLWCHLVLAQSPPQQDAKAGLHMVSRGSMNCLTWWKKKG